MKVKLPHVPEIHLWTRSSIQSELSQRLEAAQYLKLALDVDHFQIHDLAAEAVRTLSAKLVAPYPVVSVVSVLEWRDGLQLFRSLVCCDMARHVTAA